MRRAKKHLLATAVTATAVALVIGFIGHSIFSQNIVREFTYDTSAFGNPLMGYAPSAWHRTVGNDINLLYMDITWSELEPREGFFDWETIEKENRLDAWHEMGKHIVLRFVCDKPDDEEHMDIPEWLYEKIGGEGTFYDTSSGKGFAPDYNNKDFISYHKRAVKGLGLRYGGDQFISYVELGSLGHWGEWHVSHESGIQLLPEQSVRKEYIEPWIEAFPNAKILMRRPFAEAKEYGFGLYNDMTGHKDDTERWLGWIENGGEYSQTGEKDALVPMSDAWKTAPIGGELTSSIEMHELIEVQLEETVELARRSHTTFLGPKIAEAQYEEGYDELLSNMGYRIWISDMKIAPSLKGGIGVKLKWQNSGVAPMYADWPVRLILINEDYRVVETAEVQIKLSDLLPETEIMTSTVLKSVKSWNDIDKYIIKLGIIDPMTGEYAVRFAVEDAEQYGNAMVLWRKQK